MIQQPNQILRSYGYAIRALSGRDVTQFIEDETDLDMKAVLLVLVTASSITKPLLNLKVFARNKISRKDKVKIVKKYIEHRHLNIRVAALYTYMHLADKNLQDEMYKKLHKIKKNLDHNSKIAIDQRSASSGLLGFWENKIDSIGDRKIVDITSKLHRNSSLITKFKTYIQKDKQKLDLKENFEKILKFDKNIARVNYYMFLILEEEQNYKLAKTFLEKALILEKTNPLYLIEKLKYCNEKEEQRLLNYLYKETQNKIVNPRILKLISKKNNALVEKILLQNYSNVAKDFLLRKVAWDNIVDFYKANNKKLFLQNKEHYNIY